MFHFISLCLVIVPVVSASDATSTDYRLKVWCIWYTYLETLQECRSHRRIGWIIQDFRETRSLTFHQETKMPWRLCSWCWTKQTVIGCLTCQSNGLMGGPWPMNAAIYSRPSAVILKVWLCETIVPVTQTEEHGVQKHGFWTILKCLNRKVAQNSKLDWIPKLAPFQLMSWNSS